MQVNLTGEWNNKMSSSSMDLSISIKFELPSGETVVSQLSQYNYKYFDFTVPVLSSVSNDNLGVKILIIAYETNDVSNFLAKDIIINNTLSEYFREYLYNPNSDLTIMNNIAFISAQMRATLQTPTIGIETQNLCKYNSDCSEKGQ